jgi:hypothetical protein
VTTPPRVLFVTDSDSYVKWGAALADQVPKDWPVRLVVARGNAEPSARQLAEALEGTRFDPDGVARVGLGELRALLTSWRPDVLVAATRGVAVQAMVTLVANRPDRPVLVSGLAGIAVPVIPFGLGFRRAVDVFVLHSRRELREFDEASRRLEIPHTYELASLPFLATAPHPVDDAMRRPTRPEPVRDRIVFAAQAMVPSSRRERAWLLRQLVETARAQPHLQVVIKVRAREGEPQTHLEHFSYERLLDELVAAGESVPTNLLVESGAMSRHLARAVGLVTVSSTSVLEAIADGVPCLALTDFGVGADQINLVLLGSGLLGTVNDLTAATFHEPAEAWLEDNYFHDPAEDTWLPRVERLLAQRRTAGLPAYPEPARSPMNRLRGLLYRHLAFAPEPGSLRGALETGFLAVAVRVNRGRWAAIRAGRRLRGRTPAP